MNAVIVMTTVGGSFNAAELARSLVEQRVAACVNIVPHIKSVYRWKDNIDEDNEQLLLIKTSEECVSDLRRALFARHPYEVPEFVVIDIDKMEGPYRDWFLKWWDEHLG